MATTPLRVRVPTPLAEPAPGWFGPDRRGWLGHLLWQPLLTGGPVPGVARQVGADARRGQVELVATGSVTPSELLAWIKDSCPEHAAWRVGDRIVVECGPRLVDWAAFATLAPRATGGYRVVSFSPEHAMLLRRNGNAPGALPENIEVHVIPDPEETWFLLGHGMIDVALEVEPATAPPGEQPWELVTPSNQTLAVQLIRWHGSNVAALAEADRRLRAAVSTVDFCAAVYRDSAVPVTSPRRGRAERTGRVTVRLAYNVENPVREQAVGWLREAAAPAGVDLQPVPASWAELSSGSALNNADALLLTWAAGSAAEVGGRLPAWPLTRHVHLPTATRGRAAAGVVLGGTVEPVAAVLAGARAKGSPT